MTQNSKFNVALVHPFDPRGAKVGGIETFVRDYIAYHPDDMNLLMVGVDGFEDLEIGSVHKVEVQGRTIDFLPIMRVPEGETSLYPNRLTDALTLRFALALLTRGRSLRKLLKRGRYSLDLRRVELAPVAALFSLPSVQMLHDGMSKGKQMSSLLKRFWWIKELAERIALSRCDSFYCVNDQLTERLKAAYPRYAHKLATLPTWANPTIFRPTSFRKLDEGLHIAFTGRMDLFKRPDLIFRVVAEIKKINSKTIFHYVGDGDVEQFPEFDAIRDITVIHGKVPSEEVASILKGIHIGILTSDFEGMPRSVMEFLAAGRPVVALHLPQLELVIKNGSSGFLVERGPEQVEQMAQKIVEAAGLIERNMLDPDSVAKAVEDYNPQALLGRLFQDHRRIHDPNLERA